MYSELGGQQNGLRRTRADLCQRLRIHRDKLKSREGQNLAVSVTRALTVTEQLLTTA